MGFGMNRILKSLVLFVFLSVFIFINGYSQKFKAGIIGGMNVSQVDGDEVFGFRKYGFNSGLMVALPITDYLYISMETVFSQKGSYQNADTNYIKDSSSSVYRAYNLRLNYAEVPVLIQYFDKQNRVYFGTGVSWGALVGMKEWEDKREIKWKLSSNPYLDYDLNWLADIRFPIVKKWHKLFFNFRYAYSMKNIRTRYYDTPYREAWRRKQYNNLLTFRFIYLINEPKPDPTETLE